MSALLAVTACSGVADNAPFDSSEGGTATFEDGAPNSSGSGSGSGGGSSGAGGSSSGGGGGSSSGTGSGSSSGGSSGTGSSSGAASSSSSGSSSGSRDAGVTGVDAGVTMDAAVATVRYNANVASILNGPCTNACHGGCGNLNISYANMVNVPSGERPAINYVTPNDPGRSYLYCKVNPTDTVCTSAGTTITGSRMPPGGQLSAANLNTIKTWIQQGALQ